MNRLSITQKFFKILLGLNLLFAGIGHLTFARVEFLAQVPKWVPLSADLVVVLSGIVEIVLGLALLILWSHKHQKKLGLLVAFFFVLVFPGNISQYINQIDAFGLNSDRERFIRLFFQPVLILWALLSTGAMSFWKRKFEETDIFQIKFNKASGDETSLNEFQGKAFLIVNTASKCGFTPQYKGLEMLHEKYQEQGLRVLAFPCNQFLKQEPGNDKDIQEFCSLNYDIKFPVLQKIDVNGKESHPLFTHLKAQAPGALGTESVKWNFTKFLVSHDGKVIKRFSPKTKPEEIEEEIKNFL